MISTHSTSPARTKPKNTESLDSGFRNHRCITLLTGFKPILPSSAHFDMKLPCFYSPGTQPSKPGSKPLQQNRSLGCIYLEAISPLDYLATTWVHLGSQHRHLDPKQQSCPFASCAICSGPLHSTCKHTQTRHRNIRSHIHVMSHILNMLNKNVLVGF